MNPIRLWTLFAGGLLAAALSPAAVIVTYPPGTILENVAIASNGDLFVSDLGSGSLFRVSPAGSSTLFGQVSGPLAGVALDTDGTLVGTSGTSLYRFAADGTSSLVVDIAGAAFLNGVTVFSAGTFLVTDDTANTIWKVNAAAGSASPWLIDPLLVPDPGGLPFGPNGIKIFGGAVFISNTGSGTIVRVQILPDGSAGAPTVYASSLFVDDFAFGADGSLFGATQVGEIIRLYANGVRTSLPTGTLGDAAVAFGRTAGDSQDLYVVNNGGAFLGLPDGPEAASVVRIAVGTTGIVPESQVVPEPSSFLLSAGAAAVFILLRKRRRS
jgi:sugar lactone lactonase YvrE